MKLIINADDFGISPGQNYAIADCFTNGVVTSTTLMANGQAFDQAISIAQQLPTLDVGIHLTLDLGQPLSPVKEIPNLVSGPNFKKYDLSQADLVFPLNEVEIEWRRQIEKIKSTGIQISHLDSHHHIHMKEPLLPLFTQLAREYGLAIRFHPRDWSAEDIRRVSPLIIGLPRADKFINRFFQKEITPDFFDTLKDETGICEIMCHPAYLDEWLLKNSSYNTCRITEAATLQNPRTREKILSNGIQLLNFRQLLAHSVQAKFEEAT